MSQAIDNVPREQSKPHRCAKCLEPMPAPEFVVNKNMAYCEECSKLLHLGESKESRQFSDLHDVEVPPIPPELDLPPDL